MKCSKNAFRVIVADNSRYMDQSAWRELPPLTTADAALSKCREIVDQCLLDAYEPGMSAASLFESYKQFGDDPFIVANDEGVEFSAWTYAEGRCREIAEQTQS